MSLILAAPVVAAPAPSVDFTKDIQPIFEKACYSCHGSKLQSAGLRLDSKKIALPAVDPGNVADSLLYKRVTGAGAEPRMPLGSKPLDPSQLAVIRTWIEQECPVARWNWGGRAFIEEDALGLHFRLSALRAARRDQP